MIHYHGGPFSSEAVASKVLYRRHAMVSFAERGPLPIVSEVCQSFALDNGAFTLWSSGHRPDWIEYYSWVEEARTHPGFDFALIPDVIDGTEEQNDTLLSEWPAEMRFASVPVFHLHESATRLIRLCRDWRMVAIGSSGRWSTPGTFDWWQRMAFLMNQVCHNGRPLAPLHGLRQLSSRIVPYLPYHSADSTNCGRNITNHHRWRGGYAPRTLEGRGMVLADNIEHYQSSALWEGIELQTDFEKILSGIHHPVTSTEEAFLR